VLLLYGGTWDEREFSILSATAIDAALRRSGLDVVRVRWDSSGWAELDARRALDAPAAGERPLALLERLAGEGIGVVFNALHGGAGEDGSVAALLEIAGLPYTGAGVHAGAVTQHKGTFRLLARGLGYEVAPGIVVTLPAWAEAADELIMHISTEVGLPAVVKPASGGSSVGVVKVEDAEELARAIDGTIGAYREMLVERYIAGRELTIGCLGTRPGEPPQVLPAIEIQPLTDTGIFDVEAKYSESRAREIVPAPLEPDFWEYLAEQTARLHLELELGGMSRTDLIIGADGPVWLETQTIPGFTPTSLLPQAAAAAGIDFTTVCRRLIDYAISAHLLRSAGAEGADE
jgi:D-alanine-D-alanine ligase